MTPSPPRRQNGYVPHAPNSEVPLPRLNPNNLLILLTVALAIALGALVVQPSGGSANPAIENEEMKFLLLLNQYRAEYGMPPLKLQSQLVAAADWFATDMATDGYYGFGHMDNENPPRNFSTRVNSFGYTGSLAEIIAGGFLTAPDVLCGWQESGGHNSQMLNNWDIVGIGRGVGGGELGAYWVVDSIMPFALP